uniref:Pectinesterase n=1 Tax=Kalanchoe fedtschenkoi TaxID=63787 RepID=A0A7N0UGV8_KALFE
MQQRALHACIELLQLTVTHLQTSVISNLSIPSRVHDVQALLSAASTNQHTCLDGVAESKSETIVDDHFKISLVNISNQLNNALAMAAKLPAAEKPGNSSSSSLKYVYPVSEDGHPTWMTDEDRQNIVSENNECDLVVAKDGSGNFTTINEALNAAPNERSTRFVIYIKAGAYFENVVVTSKKKNIMLVGDGYDKTWIKGNRNAVDGWPTYQSAVLAVEGEGFIAKNMAIENYAGPTKFQAVALRTTADRAAFFRCRIAGYQDTLFVHSLRQFFRECEIYGTIDFIFGNSAVVFQKCSLYARRPLSYQYIVFTAQGRTSRDQTTGISIMESKMEAASDMVPDKNLFKSWYTYNHASKRGNRYTTYYDALYFINYDGRIHHACKTW